MKVFIILHPTSLFFVHALYFASTCGRANKMRVAVHSTCAVIAVCLTTWCSTLQQPRAPLECSDVISPAYIALFNVGVTFVVTVGKCID